MSTRKVTKAWNERDMEKALADIAAKRYSIRGAAKAYGLAESVGSF